MLHKLSDKRFRVLTYFNMLQIFAISIGWSLIFLFFYKKGISEKEFVLFFIAACATAAAITAFSKSINFRQFLLTGNLMRALMLVLAAAMVLINAAIYLRLSMYLIAVLWGASFFVFWVPFNILMFSCASRDEKASVAGIYFAVGTIIGVFTPAVSGFIAQHFGYAYIFLISAGLLVISAILAFFAPKELYTGHDQLGCSLKSSLSSLRKAKALILLDGVMGTITMLLLPVLTLFFIKTEMGYGLVFSLISVFNVFAMLLITHSSDKTGNRVVYIFYGVLLLSASLVIATFSSAAAVIWVVSVCAISFFWALLAPFFTTVALDSGKDVSNTMIAREFLLNSGRVIGGIVVLLFVMYSNVHLSLLFFAFVSLFYIALLDWLKVYKEKVPLFSRFIFWKK